MEPFVFSSLGFRRTWPMMMLMSVILSASSIAFVNAGNCTQLRPIFIDRAGTLYNITATEIQVHPKANGVVREDVTMAWSMQLFLAREGNEWRNADVQRAEPRL